MARIRIGEQPDPMDSMFTSNVSVDLTRNNKKKTTKKNEDSVSLNTLKGEPEEVEAPVEEEKKSTPKGTPVNVPMSQEVETFDPTTLIPKKEKFDPGVNEIFGALDAAVEKEKQEITKRHEELYEKMYEEHQDKENGLIEAKKDDPTSKKTVTHDEDDFDSDVYDDGENYEEETPVKKVFNFDDDIVDDKEDEPEEEKTPELVVKKTAADTFDYDEEEFESDMNDETSESKKEEDAKKQEEELNNFIEDLKTEAKKVLKPSKKGIDISKFTIADKGIKASKIILQADDDENIGDWVMYDSGHPISMSALTGPELIKLDPENSTRNRFNTIKDIYKIIYNHVVDSKKPGFEAWLKQTKYTDLDHIYFAMYMATFGESNYISYQCPACKKVFIKDAKFEDMIVYKDDMVKEKVKEILSQSTDVGVVEYNVKLIPVGEKYAFGMKAPSLYNVVMETAGLPENILQKYADLIDTITYIDSVYMIDYVNNSLIPVTIPTIKDDPVKNNIKRIQTLYDILKKLNSDEYYKLRGYITKLADTSSDITYMIPEATCPECDEKIEANKEIDAATLLFTRHHLGAFANM